MKWEENIMLYYDRQFIRESETRGMSPEEYLTFCAKKNNKTKEELLRNLANRLINQLTSLEKPMDSYEFKCLISYLEYIVERHKSEDADYTTFISGVYHDIAYSYMHQDLLRKRSFPRTYLSNDIIFKNFENAIELDPHNYVAFYSIIYFLFLKCDFPNTKKFLNKFFDDWDIINKDEAGEERINYFTHFLTSIFELLTNDMYVWNLPLKNKDYNLLCSSEKIAIYEDLLDFYKNRYNKFDNTVTVNEEEFVLFNILGGLYQYAGDYHKAYSIYKNWITIMPELYQSYTNLSLLSLRFNTLESGKNAEEYASKGLELLKNSKELLSEKEYMHDYYSLSINLSGALFLQEKYEEMKLLIDKLLYEHQSKCKMDKEQLNSCYHHLGSFYFKKGQYDEAEKSVQKALDLYSDETSYELFGDILAEKKLKKKALMYYRKSYKFARKYLEEKNNNFQITSVLDDEEDRIKNILIKIIRTCQQVKNLELAKEYLEEAKKYYKQDADFIELEAEFTDGV